MGINMKTGFRKLRWQEWVIFFFVPPLLFSGPARAGSYLQSAHGSSTTGVSRPVMKTAGYSQGNCANCHEQHASVGGTEPAPVNGAAPYMLFAGNFDTSATGGPYSESDDFCFYCHDTSTASVIQPVANYDYSKVFGGAGTSVDSIVAAFNQTSYHNLYDIQKFAIGSTAPTFFSWFTNYSNPCNACHNPHKARRNWSAPKNVTLSVISRPSAHFSLWGTTAAQTMGGVYGTQYEPPYSSSGFREPATSSAATGGANTPDYVALCTDCHNSTNTIYSTTLGRNLIKIDWNSATTGDQHGRYPYFSNGTRTVKSPYSQTSGTNYVLSCLNCHEPHGSTNITLLRRRVNGGDLAVVGAITTPLPNPLSPASTGNNNNRELGYLCMRCHQQDSGTGTSTSNPPKWENVHHHVTGRPYRQVMGCSCHGGGGGGGGMGGGGMGSRPPIECDKCHFHGATDAWVGNYSSQVTGRKTF